MDLLKGHIDDAINIEAEETGRVLLTETVEDVRFGGMVEPAPTNESSMDKGGGEGNTEADLN